MISLRQIRAQGSAPPRHIAAPQQSTWSKLLLMIVASFSSITLLLCCRNVAVAILLHQPRPQITAAIALAPGDARIYGYAAAWSFLNNDVADSIDFYKKAVTLVPGRFEYQIGLGTVCAFGGDKRCSDDAFRRSLQLSPNYTPVASQIANVYVAVGRNTEALPFWRRVLSSEASFPPDLFSELHSAYGDEGAWSSIVLPVGTPVAIRAFLRYLAEHGSSQMALDVYRQSGLNTLEAAEPVLRELIASGNFRDAWQLWSGLRHKGEISDRNSDKSNLVFNGGFEARPLELGFDWRLNPQTFVKTSFDESIYRDGKKSALVELTEPTTEEIEPLYQIVAVEPNQSYTASAWIRTSGITSTEGPRLRIVDLECSKCLQVSSRGLTGTNEWTPLEVEFRTTAKTHFLRVSIWRPVSVNFAREISGVFWIDSVRLVRNLP